MTNRVFLDANVLFSAAWTEGARLARLWRVPDTTLITSRHAFIEAERNLDSDERRERLRALTAKVQIVDAFPGSELPFGVRLVEKDAPILLAAIAAGATHLLTGDRGHFGALYGKSINGVKILLPAEYLKSI